MGRGRKEIPAKIRTVLDAWRKGHDSLHAQCEKHGVAYWTARYWIKKAGLSQSRRRGGSRSISAEISKPNFIRLDMPKIAETHHDLLLALPSGATLSASIAALPKLFSRLRQYGLC